MDAQLFQCDFNKVAGHRWQKKHHHIHVSIPSVLFLPRADSVRRPFRSFRRRCFSRCRPHCSGASSETRFKLKALLSISQSKFETGCFQARVKLAPPYLVRQRHPVLDQRRALVFAGGGAVGGRMDAQTRCFVTSMETHQKSQ